VLSLPSPLDPQKAESQAYILQTEDSNVLLLGIQQEQEKVIIIRGFPNATAKPNHLTVLSTVSTALHLPYHYHHTKRASNRSVFFTTLKL
jgi:hypothetical protein